MMAFHSYTLPPHENLTTLFMRYREQRQAQTPQAPYFWPSHTTIDSLESLDVNDASRGSGKTHQQLYEKPGGNVRERPFISNASPGIELTQSVSLELLTPPEWLSIVETAQEHISRIKDTLSRLQKVQHRRLLQVFEPELVSAAPHQPAQDTSLSNLTTEITQLLRQCEQAIFQITPSLDCSPPEATLRKNAQRSLAQQVQTITQQLRTQHNYYLSELEKRSFEPKLESSTLEASIDTLHKEDVFLEKFPAHQLQTHKVSTPTFQNAENHESRNADITHVARSMADLHAIFSELNTLVIDQGTLLDRIDYNLEQTATETHKATGELRKAEINRRSKRAGKIIFFLISLDLFLLFTVFIKFAHRRTG